MNPGSSFLKRLEEKVAQQLNFRHVGYLLGAGSSYLEGKGYPLSGEIWKQIATNIPSPERGEIQAKLDGGASGLEQALDLLDDGSVLEKPHRHLVITAIANHFLSITPPKDLHQCFVRRVALRREFTVPIFCLNYDGLIEHAADAERVRVVDGFLGVESPYFEPRIFQEISALVYRGPRNKQQAHFQTGTLHLYKLHGSLGWFHLGQNDVRRVGHGMTIPEGAKRLMVPPQHRKAAETTEMPYAALWSDFRARLRHGPNLLNRLVTIGYGLRDEHVNAVIENALARSNFTLLVFACSLTSEVFARWSIKKNVVIVSNNKCALYGEIGPGHPKLWSFEELARRV